MVLATPSLPQMNHPRDMALMRVYECVIFVLIFALCACIVLPLSYFTYFHIFCFGIMNRVGQCDWKAGRDIFKKKEMRVMLNCVTPFHGAIVESYTKSLATMETDTVAHFKQIAERLLIRHSNRGVSGTCTCSFHRGSALACSFCSCTTVAKRKSRELRRSCLEVALQLLRILIKMISAVQEASVIA